MAAAQFIVTARIHSFSEFVHICTILGATHPCERIVSSSDLTLSRGNGSGGYRALSWTSRFYDFCSVKSYDTSKLPGIALSSSNYIN